MLNQRHHLIDRSIERDFNARKRTGTASDLTWRKLLSEFLQIYCQQNRGPHLVSEWILTGMENFIFQKKCQQKLNNQPWFTLECSAAIAITTISITGDNVVGHYHIHNCSQALQSSSRKCKIELCLRCPSQGWKTNWIPRVLEDRQPNSEWRQSVSDDHYIWPQSHLLLPRSLPQNQR